MMMIMMMMLIIIIIILIFEKRLCGLYYIYLAQYQFLKVKNVFTKTSFTRQNLLH